jgi:hypothetical protein
VRCCGRSHSRRYRLPRTARNYARVPEAGIKPPALSSYRLFDSHNSRAPQKYAAITQPLAASDTHDAAHREYVSRPLDIARGNGRRQPAKSVRVMPRDSRSQAGMRTASVVMGRLYDWLRVTVRESRVAASQFPNVDAARRPSPRRSGSRTRAPPCEGRALDEPPASARPPVPPGTECDRHRPPR